MGISVLSLKVVVSLFVGLLTCRMGISVLSLKVVVSLFVKCRAFQMAVQSSFLSVKLFCKTKQNKPTQMQ